MKQEDIYIKHDGSVLEVKIGLTKFSNDYNDYRPQQSLNDLTPTEVYFG
ncbi:hypothetical protein COT98_00795 [Candidatus Falkowbacteria bacterium CG10_big_fil_rev_8_21_14_0_10_39_9]|uniref:Integrase catalytic domain-containing protein n=1 Tax=Candidatus Falkowbacteria bacterium CG10_big_fil_rev_8_21_14_0_10_39_9 TaxID=1974566 RepID=A0A2M6WR08_9BACT|nr:MAG: hypothetical protein COT98_00795 [Candidatus Falkowbacteria bacterium CG10_big_fil_rev_8_21_14_0_10_39_9]